MSKPEWGSKRICQSCGSKFYDLRKKTILCPSCGATFDPEALLKSRGTRTVLAKEPLGERMGTEGAAPFEADDVTDIAEVEDDLIEDTDDLGDTEDDLSEVEVDEDKEN